MTIDPSEVVENVPLIANGAGGLGPLPPGSPRRSMRLAIIAASSYVRSRKLVELVHVGLEVDLLSQRLSEPDAGFTVHTMSAERGLGQRIEEVVAGVSEPIEALLFFFTGYAVVSDEHGPTLLLDGERLSGLSLRRMRRLISQSSPSCLVVLDTVSAFDGQSPPDQVVRVLNDVLMGGQAGIHVLAANRRDEDAGDAPSPFTSLLALVLDWHSGTTGLSPQGLFAAMRSEEGCFRRSHLPSSSRRRPGSTSCDRRPRRCSAFRPRRWHKTPATTPRRVPTHWSLRATRAPRSPTTTPP